MGGQGEVLLFLTSTAAAHVNGLNLPVDAGYSAAAVTHDFPAPALQQMAAGA
ncbi:hypothetical protein ACFXAZ_05225 [Streptomyces sp. NPDC059477]|uniref:hypothetical protein n=1 Tax=Streptomyces sp. NPDC059477 TaxID=3346847 RepID=UPI00368C8557